MAQGNNVQKRDNWLVVLGDRGGKCFKTQKHFFVKGGKWSALFPMVVYVASEEEADEVLTFTPAIQLMMRVDSLREQVRLALSLPGSDTILAQYIEWFYPVVHGQRCGIFTHHNDAIEATNLTERSIWRKVAPFGRAVAYMLTKGESEKPANKDWQDLILAVEQVRVSSPEPGATCQPSPPAPTAAAPPVPPTTPTALPPASVRWSAEAQDHVFSTPTSRNPPPAPGSSQSLPPADIFEDPTFNELVFPSPHRAVDMGPGNVYQHVRNLRGIKSTHSAPIADHTQTPSCGSLADAYLQAHGYDIQSKVTVARELQEAVEMGDFVRKMCGHGLPALEAKYIWYLYEYDNGADRYWSYTHIM